MAGKQEQLKEIEEKLEIAKKTASFPTKGRTQRKSGRTN